jgi:hypothetical protein
VLLPRDASLRDAQSGGGMCFYREMHPYGMHRAAVECASTEEMHPCGMHRAAVGCVPTERCIPTGCKDAEEVSQSFSLLA